MSPSCAEGLDPNTTTLRGKTFSKWLGPEGCDLINILIPWWRHNMMVLLVGGAKLDAEPNWRK
jgi:hypothetical protein